MPAFASPGTGTSGQHVGFLSQGDMQLHNEFLTKVRSVTIAATDGSAQFMTEDRIFKHVDRHFGDCEMRATREATAAVCEIVKACAMGSVLDSLECAMKELALTEAQSIIFARDYGKEFMPIIPVSKERKLPVLVLLENAGIIVVASMFRYNDDELCAFRYPYNPAFMLQVGHQILLPEYL